MLLMHRKPEVATVCTRQRRAAVENHAPLHSIRVEIGVSAYQLDLPRSPHCPAGPQKSEGLSKQILLGPRLAFNPCGISLSKLRDLA